MNTVSILRPNRFDFDNMTTDELREEIRKLRDNEGITFAEIGRKSGNSPSYISQFVHHGKTSEGLEASLRELLKVYYGYKNTVQSYSNQIELFPTIEFKEILGFCEDMRKRRKMGVIIGEPGTGKTTAVKEFVARTEEAVYIEAYHNMRMKDLLEIMAFECGVSLENGSNYVRTKQLIRALQNKKMTFVIDEAEYLKKWDVDKFEVLRKIWDNTRTPIILVGTPVLEEHLTRGNGKDNLAQLYRRIYKMKLRGIKEKEVTEILKMYKATNEAKRLLTAIAIDYKHGGLGNFVEVLELCLEAVQGGEITAEIVEEAKNYKMLW
ncbi:AAA family ATPase [Caloranaerobacter sp. DY30410]|uniref:AAA family ATPase n=1 Tax=Caloranaerobacter sp. DY30410 TaxID=3238305 RepID=UPI003D064233